MKFKAIIAILLLLTTVNLKAQTTSVALVQNLQQAFKEKSIAPIKNRLADNFSIGAYTNRSALNMLQSLLEKYACDSISFLKETTVADMHKVDINVYRTGKSAIQSAFYTNKVGSLLYVDVFDQLYGMNRYKESKLRIKVPFEIIDNSIVLTLKLNNISRPLKFLFDTGADGMAISESLADSIGLKATRKQNASVVGGNMQISISEGNEVHLDTFSLKNQAIALFKEVHKGTDGLIGNAMTKQYITKVDFDKKELSLYDFGNYTYETAGKSIPITVPDGLFIIQGTVSVTPNVPNAADLVFDTGAAYNLICFRPFVRKNKLLVSGFKSTYHGSTSSMGMTTPTYSGKASSFSFANMPILSNLDITLMAGGGQSENWNPGFDGSLGIKLISRYNFTINLQNKEIHLTPNQNHNKPFDFILGDYVFGFNLNGEFAIQNSVMSQPDQKIKNNTVVKSVNGVTGQAILKSPAALKSLLALPSGTKLTIEYTDNGKLLKETISK